MFRIFIKPSMIICICSALLLGCATGSNIQKSDITIERIHSSTVDIMHAYLQTTAEGLILKGEVKRKRHSHMSIPGHLRIDLIDPAGAITHTIEIEHSRKGNSDHLATFSILLPATLASDGIVRITHHDAQAHRNENPEAVWHTPDEE